MTDTERDRAAELRAWRAIPLRTREEIQWSIWGKTSFSLRDIRLINACIEEAKARGLIGATTAT